LIIRSGFALKLAGSFLAPRFLARRRFSGVM
jgi:hypothetical protein